MDDEEANKYRKELERKGINITQYAEELGINLQKNRYELNKIERELGIKKKIYEESIIQYENDIIRLKDFEDSVKEKTSSVRSNMQIFMDTIKKLEGIEKKPVPHQDLIRELVDTKKAFTREEANPFVRRLLREASIYESKPNCYNTV